MVVKLRAYTLQFNDSQGVCQSLMELVYDHSYSVNIGMTLYESMAKQAMLNFNVFEVKEKKRKYIRPEIMQVTIESVQMVKET